MYNFWGLQHSIHQTRRWLQEKRVQGWKRGGGILLTEWHSAPHRWNWICRKSVSKPWGLLVTQKKEGAGGEKEVVIACQVPTAGGWIRCINWNLELIPPYTASTPMAPLAAQLCCHWWADGELARVITQCPISIVMMLPDSSLYRCHFSLPVQSVIGHVGAAVWAMMDRLSCRLAVLCQFRRPPIGRSEEGLSLCHSREIFPIPTLL